MIRTYERGAEDFKTLIYSLCEVVPDLRSIALETSVIERSKMGYRFINKEGEKVASISQKTVDAKVREFHDTIGS